MQRQVEYTDWQRLATFTITSIAAKWSQVKDNNEERLEFFTTTISDVQRSPKKIVVFTILSTSASEDFYFLGLGEFHLREGAVDQRLAIFSKEEQR